MTFEFHDVLRYWRASLADGGSGKGQFRLKDRSKLISLPAAVLKTGMLPKDENGRVPSLLIIVMTPQELFGR